ncbi:unnamed protein product [Discula destructiva]
MAVFPYIKLVLLTLAGSSSASSFSARSGGPFLEQLDNQTWVIGNDLWNLTQQNTLGKQLQYKGQDCVGNAAGHYVSYADAAATTTSNQTSANLSWTCATIVSAGTYNSEPWIDVSFTADEGDLHWVIFSGLAGAYQYFVNRAVPVLGEFRTVWRLDNTTFTRGHNNVRDELLPPLSTILPENKVQDQTWLEPDGTGYITKYDFSAFVRAQTAYGVYGPGFGSWYINAGKDYYNGNHLKQELTVHRETTTGDTVQLNMIHGTHFMVSARDAFPVGKMWGPWLWYLNDGDVEDAESRAEAEFSAWPYAWLEDESYHKRGSISGRLVLSDGRPASNAAVFLGDNNPNNTALDMGSAYYYTSYADDQGLFKFDSVREGVYGLQAWSNGSAIADVNTQFLQNGVTVTSSEPTELGSLEWPVSNKTKLFQVGDFDRYAYGFQYGGAPYEHAVVANCPANLVYTVGTSVTEDWCFGQTYLGNWTIAFEVAANASASGSTATLIVSLAGYSTGNGNNADIYVNGLDLVGNLTSGTQYLLNDPSLYRSATVAGEWRHLEFTFDANLLGSGWNNVTFEVTQNTTWRGIMWDSIILEW